MRLLLDTSTFLWLLGDSPELSPRAVALFKSAEADVYLSVASAWEIAVKVSLGKLILPAPPERLIPHERAARGITSLAIDEESALHVSRLPPLHRDPFDRMLVSQAIVHGLTILTPDQMIARYPARTVW